ncbi:hypothetical protein ACS0TY_024693 [Phlomoides rotata]
MCKARNQKKNSKVGVVCCGVEGVYFPSLQLLANELGKGGKQAPMQFVNLSDLQVDNTWSEGIFFSKAYTFGEEEVAYAQLSPQETFEKGEEQTLSDSVKSADESEYEFSQIQRDSIDTKQLDE